MIKWSIIQSVMDPCCLHQHQGVAGAVLKPRLCLEETERLNLKGLQRLGTEFFKARAFKATAFILPRLQLSPATGILSPTEVRLRIQEGSRF